jgi:hypothetical protein
MAPFAEVHVGLPRNLSMLKSYRLDSDARSLEEAIKLTPGYRIATIVDHQGRFQIAGSRNPPFAGALNRAGNGRVNNHGWLAR